MNCIQKVHYPMNFIAPFHALLKCNRASIWKVKPKEIPMRWFIPTMIQKAGHKPLLFPSGRVARRCVGPATPPPRALPDEKRSSFCSSLLNHSGYSFLLLLCCACTTTQPVDTNVKIDFPPMVRIENVAHADMVLQKVALSRSQIEWRYQQKEQICY